MCMCEFSWHRPRDPQPQWQRDQTVWFMNTQPSVPGLEAVARACVCTPCGWSYLSQNKPLAPSPPRPHAPSPPRPPTSPRPNVPGTLDNGSRGWCGPPRGAGPVVGVYPTQGQRTSSPRASSAWRGGGGDCRVWGSRVPVCLGLGAALAMGACTWAQVRRSGHIPLPPDARSAVGDEMGVRGGMRNRGGNVCVEQPPAVLHSHSTCVCVHMLACGGLVLLPPPSIPKYDFLKEIDLPEERGAALPSTLNRKGKNTIAIVVVGFQGPQGIVWPSWCVCVCATFHVGPDWGPWDGFAGAAEQGGGGFDVWFCA